MTAGSPLCVVEVGAGKQAQPLATLLRSIILAAITLYQHTLSRVLGPRCRFYPSCSHYAQDCVKKYSLPIAIRKTGQRLLRCHPFHPGGIDLP